MAFVISGVSSSLAVAHARMTPVSALMKAKELEDEGYFDIQIEDIDRVFTPEEFQRKYKTS